MGNGADRMVFALADLERADGESVPTAPRALVAAPDDGTGRDAEPKGTPRLLPYTRRDRRYLSKLDTDRVGVFRLVDEGRGVLERVLHHRGVRTASFDPEGERVISSGRHATIVWNVATPRRRTRELPLQDAPRSCGSRVHDVHCDARRLLVLSGGDYRRSAPTDYCIWDAELPDPTPIGGDTTYSNFARFRSDARLVEVDLLDGSRFVDARSGRPVENPGIEPTKDTASLRPPDERSATAPDGAGVAYVDGELVFTDRLRGAVAARVTEAPVGPFAFSPDGTLVATGHGSRTRVWRTASGELVDYLDHERRTLACATFADEGTLVTVDSGGRIDRWRVGDFQALDDMASFARARILGE